MKNIMTVLMVCTSATNSLAALEETTAVCPDKHNGVLSWHKKEILWLGTSIPYQGIRSHNSYPEIFCQYLGCNVTNNAFPGSHMRWFGQDADESCLSGKSAPRGLSATNRELHTKMAEALPDHGWRSYNESCQKLASPLEMGFEYRINKPWQEKSFDVVVIDHGHNDRSTPISSMSETDALGTLHPEPMEILSIETGKQTRLTLRTPPTLSIHDDISLRISESHKLDYWTGEVSSVDKNRITIDFDSSEHPPAPSGGIVYKYDKSKLFDAYNYIISNIYHMDAIHGKKHVLIILMTPPTEWSGGKNNGSIAAVNHAIQRIAEKWGLHFYNMTQDLDINDSNLDNFLPDRVHPTKSETRRFIAGHIVEWIKNQNLFFDSCQNKWAPRKPPDPSFPRKRESISKN